MRRALVGNVLLSLLTLASISEAALVDWVLRLRGEGLGPGAGVLLTLSLLIANAALLVTLRSMPRRIHLVYWFSRAYIVLSLGAMISGPALLVLLLLGVPFQLAGVEETVRGPFLAAGGVVFALGFGSILWGLLVGQHRLVVEEIALPIRDLPEKLAGLRIAQISDLHIGRQLRAPQIRRFVELTNGVSPDLIVITGDIFDFEPEFIEEGCRELSRLSAPLGVYAILGNHDVYTGADAVAEGVRRFTSIRLLRDEWVWIEAHDARLALLGIEDPGRGWTDRDLESTALERLAQETPATEPRILLAHRPSYFRQATRLGLDLMLCGHTHGGQISLPAPLQHHNISRLIARWTRGLFEEEETRLYVNRGIGVAGPPVRLNCPREIAVFTLVPRD